MQTFTVTGRANIVVNNGTVTITDSAGVHQFEHTASAPLQIHGSVESVKSDGDVAITGHASQVVAGRDVKCGDISGSLTAGRDVKCGKVGGSAMVGRDMMRG